MYVIRKKKIERPLNTKPQELYVSKVEQEGSMAHLVTTLEKALRIDCKNEAVKLINSLKGNSKAINRWELLKLRQRTPETV